MLSLILTPDVAEFIRQIHQSPVELTAISFTTPNGTLAGSGSIAWLGGQYRIKCFVPEADALSIRSTREWGKPSFHKGSERWQFNAKTREGFKIEFKCFPQERMLIGRAEDCMMEFSTDVLNVPTDGAEGEFPSESKTIYHAVYEGVLPVLWGNVSTSTKIKNPFLGGIEEDKDDTWLQEKDGIEYALAWRDNMLHGYVRFSAGHESRADQQQGIFAAYLKAVAFTHGLHSNPMLRELRQSNDTLFCEIGSLDKIPGTSASPLSKALTAGDKASAAMLLTMTEFFLNGGELGDALSDYHRRTSSAHEGSQMRDVDLLLLSTLFEGVLGVIFRDLPEETSDKEAAFLKTRTKITTWLKEQKKATEGLEEEAFGRFIEIVGGMEYNNARLKFFTLTDHYAIPLDEGHEVWKMWKDLRHPMAHGASLSKTEDDAQKYFKAWSRITGFINRLVLLKAGFKGSFVYSRHEEGKQTLEME
jgi:hypothetical protein